MEEIPKASHREMARTFQVHQLSPNPHLYMLTNLEAL